MKHLFSSFTILFFATSCSQPPTYLQSEAVALSKPAIEVENYFFTEATTIQIGQTLGASQVHYTIDGTSPTLQSPVANGQLPIDKSQTLTFRSIGGGSLPSEPVEVEVMKLKAQSLTLVSATPANAPYNKVPESALTDRSKAGKNFRQEAWLGYQDSSITFEFDLSGSPINGIALSCLEDQASWIFAPSAIKATFYDAAGKEVASGQTDYPAAVEKTGSYFRFLKVKTGEIRPVKIKLEVENSDFIPDWHAGKGSRRWVFLDEVVGL
jgi:hexosaminidase